MMARPKMKSFFEKKKDSMSNQPIFFSSWNSPSSIFLKFGMLIDTYEDIIHINFQTFMTIGYGEMKKTFSKILKLVMISKFPCIIYLSRYQQNLNAKWYISIKSLIYIKITISKKDHLPSENILFFK